MPKWKYSNKGKKGGGEIHGKSMYSHKTMKKIYVGAYQNDDIREAGQTEGQDNSKIKLYMRSQLNK